MIPLCAQDAPGEECFLQDLPVKAVMQASACGPAKFWANEDCLFMNYVFAYRKDKKAKVLKAENSTDTQDEISWQNVVEDVGLSGQDGKNFYALCQHVLPTTTTTTTTTTEAPTTLSREEMEQYLTKTECPLTQNAGHTTDLGSETNSGLPQIDVFLNPKRKGELDELMLWVEKNEENLTYTQVRHSRHHKRTPHQLLVVIPPRKLSFESTPTSSSCSGTPCLPAPPPTTIQTLPTCSLAAPGWAMTSTALISSLRLSQILAFVAPLTCRITWWIQTTAGWYKPWGEIQRTRRR